MGRQYCDQLFPPPCRFEVLKKSTVHIYIIRTMRQQLSNISRQIGT